MINVSKEFWEEMRTRTDFKPSASIKLSDGTVLNIDSSDFTLGNNSLVDGAGENSIPLGAAIQKNIQIKSRPGTRGSITDSDELLSVD